MSYNKNITMSLLSEDVSTVAQGNNIIVKCQTLLTPDIATHFSLLSGVFKEQVGFLSPKNSEFTYIVDLATNAPLELPEGYCPIGIVVTPVQEGPNSADFNWYFLDSLDPNTANQLTGSNILGSDMNKNVFSRSFPGYARAAEYGGFQWIAFQNNNHPTPAGGIYKVVIQYI